METANGACIDRVDWSRPWLAPIAESGRPIAACDDWRGEWNRRAAARDIRNVHGCSMSVVASDAAGDEPYEAFIARTGCVPTRDNLHDFFNALIWLRFPLAKGRLNSLQSAAIARHGVQTARGPLRDAATLIDENAVALVTLRTDLVAGLRAHQWPVLFGQQRGAWRSEISVIALGHALLEKLQHPYKAITAHALHVPLAARAALTQIDECLAVQLGAALTPQVLTPLPVLGIPGWWPPNEAPEFYADDRVFRPANMRATSQRRSIRNETR